MTTVISPTVDTKEIEKFNRIASEWWNTRGKFRPLHQINPIRVAYIRDNLSLHYGPATPSQKCLKGLKILDVGCGGGLLSEPLARLGADVTGIDASERNIAIAADHAKQMNLDIHYKTETLESLIEKGETFHAVMAMEVIEHVADASLFAANCAKLIAPGGMLFLSTINRTLKSYMYAILGAEYVLQWLPQGTHNWARFFTPAEVAEYLRAQELQIQDMKGLSYNPVRCSWHITDTLKVNYMLAAVKGPLP